MSQMQSVIVNTNDEFSTEVDGHSDATLCIPENTPKDTSVAMVTTNDPDDDHLSVTFRDATNTLRVDSEYFEQSVPER